MRIKRISFRNIGPFGAEGVTLEGFSGGLNVVCETNEFGKSSILSALEMTLFKPFSSADKQIKALRTAASDEGLEGEIIFSAEDRDYCLTKRFLKSKGARLEDAKTGELIALDRSAEEQLAGLLRSDHYAGGPSGLLWVRQGTSMDGIADDGQIASRLEGELGTLIGGARGRDYLARVEAELANILTKNGQEKKHGPLRNAREALQNMETELAEAERLQDQTRAYGVELEKICVEIERLARDAETSNRPEQIEAAQAALMTAQSYAQELELVEARHMQAKTAAERAAERQADFIAALMSFDDASQKLKDAAASHKNLLAESQSTQTKRGALNEHITSLESQLQAAAKSQSKREQHARDTQRFELLRKDREQLNARLEQLGQLQDELNALTQTMSDLPVISRRDVDDLRHAGDRLRQSESDLAALSTQLYLELMPEGREKVTLEGKTLNSGPVALTGGAALSIAGIGEIRSDDGNLREIAQQRDRAKAEYDALIDRMGIADISSASKIADERHNIEQARKRIVDDIARLAPEGRQALDAQSNTLETQARDLADALNENSADLTQIDNSKVLETLRDHRAKLEVIDDTLLHSRQAIAQSDTLQAQLSERLLGLNLPRDDAERTAQADKLASEKLKSESEMRARLSELEAIKARAPDQTLDMLTARISRLEQAAQQTQQRLEQLKTTEAGLRARRDAAFENGDADGTVKALKARLETEQIELSRQIRAKDVRILLRDTLKATQTRLREAYTAPVTKELSPLLSRVIPGAEAGLNDDLGVNNVVRNGKTESLNQLSGGTQEQFAILTRLAYAQLLAKSGASAPVILDDALVYADDARRDAMFDVLNLVASGEQPIQIIYLSCHAGATTNLGGTRLTPKPWRADQRRISTERSG